ncbi:MAG: DUF2203 domain-containing protein [Planctomycetaceae bacterium]|nr:DUF2203 domain-containing protein [Planctomycetaceae bacterium]
MKSAPVQPTNEQSKRFFTLAEANQRLPLVRVIVSDIVELFRDVTERRQRLIDLIERNQLGSKRVASPYTEELEQMQADIQADVERLNGFAQELADLGIELKDPNIGLIDFPTQVDGREAYLCWKLGEPEVGFWHELTAGVQGRQPVEDLRTQPRFSPTKT